MTETYHFGVPGVLIWLTHLFFGWLFIYLGYLIVENKPVNKYYGILFIVLGVLMILYHAHLWYYNNTDDYKNKENK